MSSRLDELLDALSIEKGAATGLVEAADVAADWLHVNAVDDELQVHALQAVDKIKAAAPRLAETGTDELRELLSTGFGAQAAGFPEGIRELAYRERRKLFRAVTVEETKAARLRAERLDFLAELLEDLGSIALKVLPLLIAAL